MSDVDKLMKRVADQEAPITARKIVEALKADRALALTVLQSPDPLRAAILESGVIPDPASMDGNHYYHAIIAELKKLKGGV